MQLNGKAALVTGGARGIGRAIVEAFCEEGAGVAFSDLNVELGHSAAEQLRKQGYNVLFPIGFDAYGLPTENYAIKTGTHPRIVTDNNIAKDLNGMKRYK